MSGPIHLNGLQLTMCHHNFSDFRELFTSQISLRKIFLLAKASQYVDQNTGCSVTDWEDPQLEPDLTHLHLRVCSDLVLETLDSSLRGKPSISLAPRIALMVSTLVRFLLYSWSPTSPEPTRKEKEFLELANYHWQTSSQIFRRHSKPWSFHRHITIHAAQRVIQRKGGPMPDRQEFEMSSLLALAALDSFNDYFDDGLSRHFAWELGNASMPRVPVIFRVSGAGRLWRGDVRFLHFPYAKLSRPTLIKHIRFRLDGSFVG